jgi:solute carrier family 25 (mitochondrial citrate transporter), member 1
MTQSRRESLASATEPAEIVLTATPPQPSLMESFASGATAGGVEVLADHPLWTIKTRMQRCEPFTLNPLVLYRGIIPNMVSMVPISALQVGLDRSIHKIFFSNSVELSDTQRLGSAFVAGIGSSLVSCPTEMVMTTQGKKHSSFYKAGNYLVSQAGLGCLYNGWLATALREGTFTACYLAVTPILKKIYEPYFGEQYQAELSAGITAGICGSLASQAVDTIKTIQQDADPLKPVSVVEAVKQVHQKYKWYGFFKGGLPRAARVTAAVYIMGEVTEGLEKKFSRK